MSLIAALRLSKGPLARRALALAGTAVVLAIGLPVLDTRLADIAWTHAQTLPVDLIAVQPERNKRHAWTLAERDRMLDLLESAIDSAPRNSLVVTPETFMPEVVPATPLGRWADLLDKVEARQVHVLLGLVQPVRHDNTVHAINTVHQLSPGRQAIYGKERLVPGGEHLPFHELLAPIYRLAFENTVEKVTPSPPEWTAPLFAAGTNLGVSICHEQAYAYTMARRAEGTSLLVSVSDDSWIPSQAYRTQMLGTARLRAMEFGKPMLRVSNGGQSVLIDHQGRIAAAAAGLGPEVLTTKTTPRDGNTPYGWANRWIAAAPVLAWCLAMLWHGVPLGARALRHLKQRTAT